MMAPAMTSSSDTAALRYTGVSKTYGKGALAVHALREVDFVARAGELVILAGPSGSGKSSLLRAGLLPAVDAWRHVVVRPGERPLTELRRALGAELAEVLERVPAGGRLVLAVDQLEELAPGQADRARLAGRDRVMAAWTRTGRPSPAPGPTRSTCTRSRR